MRTAIIRNLFLLPVLIAGLGVMPVGRLTAQTFTVLHSFTGGDGTFPYAGLVLSGSTMYGTTALGGGSDGGTVFAVNSDGTGFTTLYSFNGNDGVALESGLILSGDTLYGTATGGGSSGVGIVFALNTDGTAFRLLHSFTGGSDGRSPPAGLILSDNFLYGTAPYGGSSARGTVFKVNTNGTGFTILHSFAGPSDGGYPVAVLILSGNTLYGTAAGGGSSSNGTVFKVDTDASGFKNLYSFTARDMNTGTNSDGAEPSAGLILSGNTLYGTAYEGGSGGNGTVFKVNTDGTGFTTLHSFAGPGDGANPEAGLILLGNTLYGTAAYGGSSGNGTVFAVGTDGTGFTNLYSFTGGSDGGDPTGGLILSGKTLYGSAQCGGSSGKGTLFSISLPVSSPQLTIAPSGVNIILTWPTNAAGFTLQSAPALTATFINIPGVTSPYTNAITGAQQFFRLASP